MTDLLLDALPTRWAGRRVDPDFRHMVWLANAYARREPEAEPLRFAREAVARFYAAPEDLLADPARMADAYRHLLEFYLGNDAATPEKSSGSASVGAGPAYDYHCDAPYIVAAFQQAYGIDLTCEQVHWWRFRALLRSLPEDCLFCRILHWRTADLTDMPPEQRRFYEDKRQIFALPPELKGGAARAVSVAEHEAAFLARFQRR